MSDQPQLTPKQRLFVEQYLDCLNALEAARRAGYRSPHPEGARLLQNATIRAALDAELRKRTLPKDEVLARFTAMARADVRDLLEFDEDGNATGLRLHRDAPLHLIKSITPTKYGNKLELHDQQYALTKIGEAYGIFRDRIADNLDIIATAAQSLDAKLSAPMGPGAPDGVSAEPDADRESDPQP